MLRNNMRKQTYLVLSYNKNEEKYFYEVNTEMEINTENKEQFTVTKKEVLDIFSDITIEQNFSNENKIYTWLLLTEELNKYNQLKLKGLNFNIDVFELTKEEEILKPYIWNLLKVTQKYTNTLKLHHKMWVKSWKELYQLLGIHSRPTQLKFKKYVEKTNLIKKVINYSQDIRFVVNPLMIRKSVYIDIPTLYYFIDGIINTPNCMEEIAYKYLTIFGKYNKLDLREGQYFYEKI